MLFTTIRLASNTRVNLVDGYSGLATIHFISGNNVYISSSATATDDNNGAVAINHLVTGSSKDWFSLVWDCSTPLYAYSIGTGSPVIYAISPIANTADVNLSVGSCS